MTTGMAMMMATTAYTDARTTPMIGPVVRDLTLSTVSTTSSVT